MIIAEYVLTRGKAKGEKRWVSGRATEGPAMTKLRDKAKVFVDEEQAKKWLSDNGYADIYKLVPASTRETMWDEQKINELLDQMTPEQIALIADALEGGLVNHRDFENLVYARDKKNRPEIYGASDDQKKFFDVSAHMELEQLP